MSQVKTRLVSLESIIKDPYFKKGFNDVKRGKPFEADLEVVGTKRKSAIERMWNYERGRHFAYFFDGKLVENYKVSFEARAAWAENFLDII